MSKVCLSLVLLAIAYVVSRAAEVEDNTTSAAPATGIPAKNDPWKDSSEEEDEQKDQAVPGTQGEQENLISQVTRDLRTINDTVKVLEKFYEEGKKTPPDTQTLMQAILLDAAYKGPFYFRSRQDVSTGTQTQQDCFFRVGGDVSKLMFLNYNNLENCTNIAKAAYEAALQRVDNKIQNTKEKLNDLTEIRNDCENPVLDKMKDCLTPFLSDYLNGAIQIVTGALKAQFTYVKRIGDLTESYKNCAGQANSTLYEKLEPIRTAAEECLHK